jgi:serine/threonine protein kinase
MAVDVMRKLVRTLGFLHSQGIVHRYSRILSLLEDSDAIGFTLTKSVRCRDLKPENILCKKGSDTDIKVTLLVWVAHTASLHRDNALDN